MAAKIKFCGIMQPGDATLAAGAGAGYLGVVFAGGPRAVSIVGAREVVRAAGGVPVLGVFAAQSPDEILRALGGAGVSLDLELGRRARGRLTTPMALAGGLTPDNVGQALVEIRPEIVEVSSGVERRPGIKDPNTIARFVEAVFAYSSVT